MQRGVPAFVEREETTKGEGLNDVETAMNYKTRHG